MRNLLFLARVVVVSFIVSLRLYAQPYPTTSYQLDEEGKTIVKWLGSEAELDLSSDPAFSAIETIGSKAFANCRDLKTIILPEKTTNIEGGAFGLCNELAEITWGNALVSIGEDAFFACKRLKKIDLKSVQNIGNTAFSGCAALEEIFIPKTLEELGYSAFGLCIYNHRTTKTNQKYPSVNL